MVRRFSVLLVAMSVFFGCVSEDYPYFLKKSNPCIGSRYEDPSIMLLFSYTEGTYGHPSVKRYLEEDGHKVIAFDMSTEEQETLTFQYLEDNQVAQIWLFSSCSGSVITESTVNTIYEYTEEGCSLVIAADNLPCTGDTEEMSKMFDVSCGTSSLGIPGTHKKEDDTLLEHCITRNLDSLDGGDTPCNITYPDNEFFSPVAVMSGENLLVVYEDKKRRVFYDGAWTRYGLHQDYDEQAKELTLNITGYLNCECD